MPPLALMVIARCVSVNGLYRSLRWVDKAEGLCAWSLLWLLWLFHVLNERVRGLVAPQRLGNETAFLRKFTIFSPGNVGFSSGDFLVARR